MTMYTEAKANSKVKLHDGEYPYSYFVDQKPSESLVEDLLTTIEEEIKRGMDRKTLVDAKWKEFPSIQKSEDGYMVQGTVKISINYKLPTNSTINSALEAGLKGNLT
jgi:hypothetical protein